MKKQEETKQTELAAKAAEYKAMQAQAENVRCLLLICLPYSCLRFLKSIFIVAVPLEEYNVRVA